MNRSWVRFPPLAPAFKPRTDFFRGVFIGVKLVSKILKKTIAFCISLLITAGCILSCFSTESSADGNYDYSLSGSAFISGNGHSVGNFSSGILTIGQTGSGKGLQTLSVNLKINNQNISGSLQYRVHINKKGWQDWTDNGKMTNITTMPKVITGIQMRLTGDLAEAYSIWYAAGTHKHKDNQGWVCDGAQAGSALEGSRIEGFRVMLVARNRINGYTGLSFRSKMQSTGWAKTWTYSNHTSGRPGKKKRLFGIELSLTGYEYTGGIEYRCQLAGRSGWQKWVSNGLFCGSSYSRLEAIEIKLTGEVANHYDIYYRTYSGGLGWFNWAKNGEASGTRGIGRHLEAIQICLVKKGAAEPGAVNKVKSKIGYKYVAATGGVGVSEWRIGIPGKNSSFGAAVVRRAKHYNRTEYKDMRCDSLVTQVLADTLGSTLGKAKGKKYPRLNEWLGLSALEALLSSTFTYKDSSGRTIICRPVAKTKLKKLYKKTWKRKEKYITEVELNTWLKNNCKPGDIIVFYNKNKKPIHCGIYSGIQSGSAVDYEYFHGKNKGKKESDIRPGPYMWHSGYDTGVSNKYVFWAAEIGGRAKYIRRYRVDSGKSQPAPPKQQ